MAIWLDVTSILRWTGRPVGIIRVESELARSLLRKSRKRYLFCRYDFGNKTFHFVPDVMVHAALKRLSCLSIENSRPSMPQQELAERLPGRLIRGSILKCYSKFASLSSRIKKLYNHLDFVNMGAEKPITWSKDDTYISVGLDWVDKDQRVLMDLKHEMELRLVLCCYDIIPILHPELCFAVTRERFPNYIRDLARCADTIICISKSTRDDLSAYLRHKNIVIPPLRIIQLGTDIPSLKPDIASCSSDVLDVIMNGPFILMVSTIEPRKGHEVLYKAYQHLHSLNRKDIPLLVFAGRKGWGVDSLITEIGKNPDIGDRIKILETLSDYDLSILYQHCLFTVFPSIYEGWGLPVSESLSRGKFCIASNTSSIPEAGGTFCHYIDIDDDSKWAQSFIHYLDNPNEILACENYIKHHYIPHSWQETSNQVLSIAESLHPTS
jgi:glycosyltransferase involved in cell wall biosynthesis